MKYKLLVVGLPLMLALASASADAAPRFFAHSGVQCQQADHVANNIIDRTQYGIHNTSLTDGVTVECPINVSWPSPSNRQVTSIAMSAYDRNPSPSIDVSCDAQRIDGNGNVTYTTNLRTSGSGAGVQSVIINPSGTVFAESIWRLRCWLPPATSGNNFSHLVYYSLAFNDT
jgi:hypothetical protein